MQGTDPLFLEGREEGSGSRRRGSAKSKDLGLLLKTFRLVTEPGQQWQMSFGKWGPGQWDFQL